MPRCCDQQFHSPLTLSQKGRFLCVLTYQGQMIALKDNWRPHHIGRNWPKPKQNRFFSFPTTHQQIIFWFFFQSHKRHKQISKKAWVTCLLQSALLWAWWVMVSSFRLWRWDPSDRFSRESGIFSVRWLSEGSALPGKGGRQSLNNSGQSQESRSDGVEFQTSRCDSNYQLTGSAIMGRTPVLWALVSFFRQGGWSGRGGGGEDYLQSLSQLPETLT